MDAAQLKTDLADDLRELGSYSTDAGGLLERSIMEGAKWLTKKRDWNFILAQSSIVATDGNKGPYSVPADFDRLAGEARLTKYYAYDAADVDPPVQDGQFNRRFEMYLLRSSGTPTINFYLNPGTRTLTFTYRKTLRTIADLTGWPEDVDLKECLKNYASYAICSKTPELQAAGANFKVIAEGQRDELWKDFRKGSSRPDNRTPQDVFGQGLYQNYAGEYL